MFSSKFLHSKCTTFFKNIIPQRNVSKNAQTSVQVSVLNATTSFGRYASFLLKQNPYLSCIHLHGDKKVHNLGADLCFMDTKCQVKTYDGEQNLPGSVKSADIVLMMPSEIQKEISFGDRVMEEGKKVHKWAQICSMFAPRTIIIVCVPPISVMMPIVEAVFKQTNFYHPGRIIGSASCAQVTANSLLGSSQDLDATICQVPLLGGPDLDLAIPLFSKSKPIDIYGKAAKDLTAKFRGVRSDEFPKVSGKPNSFNHHGMCVGFSNSNLVTNIAMGICGDPQACANVFMRSNLISGCQHLVTTVRFAQGGIVHNFGIPQLSPLELELFEKAVLEISNREKMALEFVTFAESKSKENELPPFKVREIEEQELKCQKTYKQQ